MSIESLLGKPMVHLAAGLLDPRGTYGSFGASLNRGLQGAGQAQQLQSLMAVSGLKRKKLEEEAKQTEEFRKALAAAGIQGISTPEQLNALIRANQQAQGPDPYYTSFPTEHGLTTFDARSGQAGFVPYPEGAGPPMRYDPTEVYRRGFAGQLGTGQAEARTDPVTAAAVSTATARAERTHAMTGISASLDLAQSILEGKKGALPTGSGAGAAYDYAGSIFGHTPEGAAEAAQLEAIGGSLVAKMPRMEGPQSDKDVILYKQMAGKIGDRTATRESRLRALKAVRDLWAKYEGITPSKDILQQADEIIGDN